MMLAYQHLRTLVPALGLTLLIGCHKPTSSAKNGSVSSQKPAWLEQKISEFQAAAPTNPPVKIYRYHYKGGEVYFITSRCCDIPSAVYSAQGEQLCQPDGGITGRGDGKCPDFFETRTEEKLIWEDLRK